jgi:hypothetical protein
LKKTLFLVLIILAGACNSLLKNRDERVLARVFDEMLYESELSGLVPKGSSRSDSLAITRNYIDNWVQQQLLIRQASRNLSGDQMDFTKQLEDYKNSLIIYAYENALISQSLDTLVSEDELQNYYDQNQQNFLLKDNIVQFQYVKLPLNTVNVGQFRKLLNAGTEESQTRLSELCEKQAVDYFLDDRNWVLFNDLLRQIPVKTYNQEEFLKNHREFESQDSVFIYLVRFRDFKIKETISPFNYEKKRIRDIILNKRKIDLLYKMREDLYNRALKSNDVEIF